MTSYEGEFRRIHSGLPYFARVSIRVAEGTGEIAVACRGAGFTSQGSIEDASAIGYDDWKAGATAGVRHALSHAGRDNVNVTILRITGMSTDTNATIVGAAAMKAVWTALGVETPSAEWARVEEIVFSSWQRPTTAR